MRCYQRKDFNGIMMNYKVVAKDHFLGYVVLDSIPEKSPGHIANVLQKMFGHFGYPKSCTLILGKSSLAKCFFNSYMHIAQNC